MQFIRGLGVSYTDVWGLDEAMLEMVPKPVFAVLLLFPITENYIAYRNESEAQAAAQPPAVRTTHIQVHLMHVFNGCITVCRTHVCSS